MAICGVAGPAGDVQGAASSGGAEHAGHAAWGTGCEQDTEGSVHRLTTARKRQRNKDTDIETDTDTDTDTDRDTETDTETATRVA